MDEIAHVDDPHCVEGQQLTALYKLCRGSSGKGATTGDKHYEDAARALGDLIAALDAAEPNNHRAYYTSAQFASRMAGRHPLVLQQATTLIERARRIEPNSAEYLIELAYQKSLVGDTKVADPPSLCRPCGFLLKFVVGDRSPRKDITTRCNWTRRPCLR